MKPDIDLTGKVKFQTQFDKIFGTRASQNVACCKASKKMISDCGFTPVAANKRVDAVVLHDGKLARAQSWDEAVSLLHENLDNNKPVLVGVNRGGWNNDNGNHATTHFVVIVGRRYNDSTGKYEYPFYDPGTSHADQGTHEDQFFTLKDGFWRGISHYCKKEYIITEVRPTL